MSRRISAARVSRGGGPERGGQWPQSEVKPERWRMRSAFFHYSFSPPPNLLPDLLTAQASTPPYRAPFLPVGFMAWGRRRAQLGGPTVSRSPHPRQNLQPPAFASNCRRKVPNALGVGHHQSPAKSPSARLHVPMRANAEVRRAQGRESIGGRAGRRRG